MIDTMPGKEKFSVSQYVVEFDMAYLATRPRMIPAGRVLVHNHTKHSKVTKVNLNGFRAWYQKPNETLTPCKCGWARLPGQRNFCQAWKRATVRFTKLASRTMAHLLVCPRRR